MAISSSSEAGNDAFAATNFPFEHDERWLLVQRIIRSTPFVKASQLREILIYVTRQILLDEGSAIPEHEIAYKVLGRRESFNPNDDNIVRVQAGHLRKKLDQYFSTEGREEPYVLVIPKGTYVPHFVPRQNAEVLENAVPKVEQSPSEAQSNLITSAITSPKTEQEPAFLPFRSHDNSENEPPVSALTKKPFTGLRWYWLLVAFGLGIGVMVSYYRLTSTSPSMAAVSGLPLNMIEQRIFASGAPLSIVTTDSSLVLLQNTLHTDISIADYVGGHYPSSLLTPSLDEGRRITLEKATTGRYTSLGDLTIAWQCQELAQKLGTAATLRYARYMNVRDFEKGNFILIGSRRGNPWISLFEPQLNFALEEDKETHFFHFANKNPQAGEQKTYPNEQQPHGEYISYVDIALVPNLTKTGYVLLLNGSVMDSNEAAARLIFDGDISALLPRAVKNDAAGKAIYFEIFLRVHSLEGAASKCDVIATRTGVMNS